MKDLTADVNLAASGAWRCSGTCKIQHVIIAADQCLWTSIQVQSQLQHPPVRCIHARVGCVLRTGSQRQQVGGKLAACVSERPLEQGAYRFRFAISHIEAKGIRLTEAVEKGSAAVPLAVHPPVVVNHCEGIAPAQHDVVTQGWLLSDRSSKERLSMDRLRRGDAHKVQNLGCHIRVLEEQVRAHACACTVWVPNQEHRIQTTGV